MRIVVNITASENGRLTGTVSTGDGQVPFSGAMEFLAAVEGLCLTGDRKVSTETNGPKGIDR